MKTELDSKPMPPLLEWPTIKSLLSHLPHLKRLIFTVFTDNRIKGDRPFKQLVPQLVTYLVGSRVKSPLEHLDLNLNESVFGPADDYSALLPLMPQLVHFGLNAEATGDSVMRLLMAASSRLASLKVDIVHCKESDFAETSEMDEQTDRLNISSKIVDLPFLKSLTSLTFIDCEYSQFTDYWLQHFSALNTLVLGEKAGLDDDDFHVRQTQIIHLLDSTSFFFSFLEPHFYSRKSGFFSSAEPCDAGRLLQNVNSSHRRPLTASVHRSESGSVSFH